MSRARSAIPDRVLIGATLPWVLLERSEASAGITPVGTIAVSAPRISATVQAWGQRVQPHKDPPFVDISAALWILLRAISSDLPQQTSDTGVLVRAGRILSGTYRALIWSALE